MMNKNDTFMLNPALQKQRQNWLNAYQNKAIDIMDLIESKDFFVVFYQNVEKKTVWHENVKNIWQDDDPLINLLQTDKNIKIRYDCINSTSHIITSFLKGIHQTTLIKEMWEEQNQVWRINSLVINLTPVKTV